VDETAGRHKGEVRGATNDREARVALQRRMGQAAMGTAPKAGEKYLCYGDLRALTLLSMEVDKLKSLERLANGELTVKGLTKLDEYFGWTKENPTGGKVTDFDPADWDSNFILARRQEGVSDATIINSGKLLRKMFSIAVEKGRLLIAPKFAVPTAPDAKEHVLYKEQFDQLLKAVNKKFIPLLTFLFYQGTRTAEALNLTWGKLTSMLLCTIPTQSSTRPMTPNRRHCTKPWSMCWVNRVRTMRTSSRLFAQKAKTSASA